MKLRRRFTVGYIWLLCDPGSDGAQIVRALHAGGEPHHQLHPPVPQQPGHRPGQETAGPGQGRQPGGNRCGGRVKVSTKFRGAQCEICTVDCTRTSAYSVVRNFVDTSPASVQGSYVACVRSRGRVSPRPLVRGEELGAGARSAHQQQGDRHLPGLRNVHTQLSVNIPLLIF